MRFFVSILFTLFFFSWAWAQETDKFTKPLNTKNPSEKKDTVKDLPSSNKSNAAQHFPGFDPQRKPTVVSEDTTEIDEGELSVVEVTEEVRVDSSWIKIAEYYSVWDSRNVDPYGIDPKDYEDSVEIQLYDETQNQLWAPPLSQLKVNSHFGMRGYRWHYGTDLDLNTGDTIRAAFDGIVRIVRYEAGGWGYFVLLRHYNGLETLYGHMSKQLAEVGQLVKAGDIIGLGGSTGRSSGPHLHYEIRYQGNAFNPDLLYNYEENKLKGQYFYLLPQHFSYIGQKKTAVVRRLVYYRVRKGDTLGGLASRHGTTVTKLMRLNRLRSKTIRAGQRLRIR
jgi:murein DD-endopeptidase MepM/ murein hydrolase activator NlpD